MALLLYLLATVLSLVLIVVFYIYGGLMQYHSKLEAIVKAFFFSVVMFAIYFIPYMVVESGNIILVLIVMWSLFWLYHFYRQATSPWVRTIR